MLLPTLAWSSFASAEEVGCFPSSTPRADVSKVTTIEAARLVRETRVLKLRISHAQLCDDDVQRALLEGKGEIDLVIAPEAFAETAVIPV